MGASVSHLAPHLMAPRPGPSGQQALCVRPLENGHDRGRQEELLLAGDPGDGGQVLPDLGGHREGGWGLGLFPVATGSPGGWVLSPGGDRGNGEGRQCSVALLALPSGPTPITEAPLTSSVPSCPLSPPRTMGPGQAGVLVDLPIVPAPASCPSALSLGPGPLP